MRRGGGIDDTDRDFAGYFAARRDTVRRTAYLRFYLRPRYVLSRLGRRNYGSLLRQARILVSQAVG